MRQAADYFNSFIWNAPETCAHRYLLVSLRDILNQFAIPKVAQVLDAGCGGGHVLHRLYQMGYENVHGFDASQSGIETARQSYPEISGRFKLHNAYERLLPEEFADKEYDLVLSMEVIEHLYSPRIYLQNIHSWLGKEGLLILTTPYHGYIKNLSISLLNKFDSHFQPLAEGGHIKFFSKTTIRKILEDCSFKPVRFLGSGRLPYLWKSMVVVAQKVGN